MKKTIYLCNTLFAVAISTSINHAQANEKFFGFQYAGTTYSETGFSDIKPTALIGRIGKTYENNTIIEGRFGIGLSDDSYSETIFGIPFELSTEIDNLLGIYGIARMPVSKSISAYGLLGITRAELTATVTVFGLPVSVSDDDTSLSYGVGADINVNSDTAINIEYVLYLDGSDYDLSALNIGARFDF